MKYLLFVSLFPITFTISVYAQQAYTLKEVIDRATGHSTESKRAETIKENSYWRFRNFRAGFNPQLRLTGNLPTYDKYVTPVLQPDGTFKYLPVEQMTNSLGLGLEQPLLWTGGTISANSSLYYFNNFNDASISGKQWSGSVFNVRLEQPIFAYNELKWSKKIEPLAFEESKRRYSEQRESISKEAVARFFAVLMQQANVEIAQFNLANNDTIYRIEQGRFNIGTTSLDKLLQVELQLLRSKESVAKGNVELDKARLQLRSFIGITDLQEFPILILPEEIPAFEVQEQEALLFAKEFRADFIGFERRSLEGDRQIAEATGSRLSVSLNTAFGLNNNGLTVGEVYSAPRQQQQVSLSFNIPLVDWGRYKSSVGVAMSNKKLMDYTIAQEETNFEETVINQVRQFHMLRLQIEIAKKSDQVASERYNVSQNRYLIGKIDITNLNIALTEKDEAKRSYIQALESFWTAFYELRRLTLYDFVERKFLYSNE